MDSSILTDNLIDRISIIEPERKYFFVRTDSGLNFEEFYTKGFIGIGWNFITLSDLTKLSPIQIKSKIGKNLTDDIDLETSKGKSKATGIYTKLIRFKSLKKGDFIVIPSAGSSRLAFGVIQDHKIYIQNKNLGKCSYYKRRKVKWLEVKNQSELDPIFYRIKTSRHSISDVSKYGDYIDFVTNTLYIKDDKAHFVFDIKTTDEINVTLLLNLMESIQTITSGLNEHFNLGENINDNTVRLNLQSPGKVTFKLGVKIAAVFAAILSLHTCAPNSVNLPDNEKAAILGIAPTYKNELDSLESTMKDLKIDQSKMNSFK